MSAGYVFMEVCVGCGYEITFFTISDSISCRLALGPVNFSTTAPGDSVLSFARCRRTTRSLHVGAGRCRHGGFGLAASSSTLGLFRWLFLICLLVRELSLWLNSDSKHRQETFPSSVKSFCINSRASTSSAFILGLTRPSGRP